MIEKFILKVKRKETVPYTLLYDLAVKLKKITLPDSVIPLYGLIYLLRTMMVTALGRLVTFLYLEPMFRSKCNKVGAGLNYVKLQQSFPYFSGNIQIFLGDNVTVHSRSSFAAAKVFDAPVFKVGNNTYLGPGLTIGVAKLISIGSCCLIASNVSISDNDGHPLDPEKRARHDSVDKENIIPIHINDNVWVGEGAMILKGVTIGECSVIAARSVVTSDVAPYMVVAGNPAVKIKDIKKKDRQKIESACHVKRRPLKTYKGFDTINIKPS